MQNFPDSFIMTVYVPGGGMKISSPGNLCRIGNCERDVCFLNTCQDAVFCSPVDEYICAGC